MRENVNSHWDSKRHIGIWKPRVILIFFICAYINEKMSFDGISLCLCGASSSVFGFLFRKYNYLPYWEPKTSIRSLSYEGIERVWMVFKIMLSMRVFSLVG